MTGLEAPTGHLTHRGAPRFRDSIAVGGPAKFVGAGDFSCRFGFLAHRRPRLYTLPLSDR